jgi:predicted metallopeptidase
MADFIKDTEVERMARTLIKVWPDALKHVDPDRMLYVREISASQRTTTGACLSVFPPYNLLNPNVVYIVAVYWKASWDNLNEAQRAALVMHQLLHIPPDFGGGVNPHDVQDFQLLVDNFGSDYLLRTDVPNLLEREEGATREVESESE